MDQVIALIMAAYPNFTANQGKVYSVLLSQEYPVPVIKQAVVNVIKNSKFMPTVAEILDECKTIVRYARQGEHVFSAESGWQEVYRAIGRDGIYNRPTFKDPLTAEVISMMGWGNICMSEADSMPVIRAQFLKMYHTLEERKETDRRMRKTLANGKIRTLVGQTAKLLEEGQK